MTSTKSSLGDLAFQAEGGDAGAQYRLGVIFLLGEVAGQDTEAAYRWLCRAAAGGNEGAKALVEKLLAVNLASRPGEGRHTAKVPIGERVDSPLISSARACVQRMLVVALWFLCFSWVRELPSDNRRLRFRPFRNGLRLPSDPSSGSGRRDEAVPLQNQP